MELFLLNAKIIAACFLIFLTFGIVGARVVKTIPDHTIDAELHTFFGWAIAILIMLGFAPWMSGGALIAFLLLLCAASYFMLRSHTSVIKSLSPAFLGGFLLLLPLLYSLCTYSIQEWDDFSHWLPNAHFLFQYGRFPVENGPVHYSAWPAYPYGFSLLIASTGWITGQFIETAGPMMNVCLLVLFASFLAKRIDPEANSNWKKIRLCAALFFILTAFNPGFNEFLTLSSYGEHVTAILLAFILFYGWKLVSQPNRADAICFGVLALIFVQVKQANAYLLLMTAGSLWLTAADKKRAFGYMVAALMPALLVNGYWEFYKSQNLAGLAFSFKPLKEWFWDLLPALFKAMGDVVLSKSGYFALLIGLTGFGLVQFFKKRDPLLSAFSILTLCYFSFLILAYMGSSFSEWEIRAAASFYRYMSHLEFAAMMIVIFKVSEYVRSHARNHYPAMRMIGTLLVIAIPCTGIAINVFDILPKPQAFVQEARNYARAIFPKIPPKAMVGLIGTESDGLEMPIFKYEWALQAGIERSPQILRRITRYSSKKSAEDIRNFAESLDAVMVTPHDGFAFVALDQPVENNWVSYVREGNTLVKILP